MYHSFSRPALQAWSAGVLYTLRLDYVAGAAEQGRWTVQPDRRSSAVVVAGQWDHERGPASTNSIDWHRLPGDGLLERGFASLSLHLSGAIDLPPHIRGDLLWHTVTASAWLLDDPSVEYRMETIVCGPHQALLRERRGPREQWMQRKIELDAWDADPLRAVLRLGMHADHPNFGQRVRHLWQLGGDPAAQQAAAARRGAPAPVMLG